MSINERDEPPSIVDGRWPRFVGGGPGEVRATLERMVEESGADELMIQDLIADPALRRRSHELVAEAFGLEPRPISPRRQCRSGLVTFEDYFEAIGRYGHALDSADAQFDAVLSDGVVTGRSSRPRRICISPTIGSLTSTCAPRRPSTPTRPLSHADLAVCVGGGDGGRLSRGRAGLSIAVPVS